MNMIAGSAISLLLSASAAVAQQVDLKTDMASATDMSPAGFEWKPIDNDASSDTVLNALSEAGWPKMNVAGQLIDAEKYDLFSRSARPGVISYLAVPQNSVNPPVEFSPMQSGAEYTPALFGGGPSASEIREEIIEGMQAAIDALCGMNARPTTIRAQASAFGVVEVEATWTASEVCEIQ